MDQESYHNNYVKYEKKSHGVQNDIKGGRRQIQLLSSSQIISQTNDLITLFIRPYLFKKISNSEQVGVV